MCKVSDGIEIMRALRTGGSTGANTGTASAPAGINADSEYATGEDLRGQLPSVLYRCRDDATTCVADAAALKQDEFAIHHVVAAALERMP